MEVCIVQISAIISYSLLEFLATKILNKKTKSTDFEQDHFCCITGANMDGGSVVDSPKLLPHPGVVAGF